MKPLRRKNLRFMTKNNKTLFALAFLALFGFANAQENDEALRVEPDTTTSVNKTKLDGIAAVIGDYVILESDIDKTLIDLQSQGASTEDITRCGLLGKLMEDRLYAHQAVQDSLLVSDEQVNAQSDRQIQQLVAQVGSMEKVLKFYKKPDVESFRTELFEINKLRMLSEKMQSSIVEKIEVTPEE
ncbi:MAG: peptidylprolyl isomerase, partial [Flavobacteriia bacterium]